MPRLIEGNTHHTEQGGWDQQGTDSPFNAMFRDDVGTEAQHCEDHQRGQNRGEEVDSRDEEPIKVAVVVAWVVTRVGDDGAKAQAQRKEHLGGRLTPDLHISPDGQLGGGGGQKAGQQIFRQGPVRGNFH